MNEQGSWKMFNMFIRGVQKNKKFDSELALWFFPLYWVSGFTTKNFSSLAYLEVLPLEPFIIQRKFRKIQRKILKVTFSIGLHSLGTDACIDNRIDIFINDMCRMACVSKMAVWHKWRIQGFSWLDMEILVSTDVSRPQECGSMPLNRFWIG